MTATSRMELLRPLTRYAGNPILVPDQMPVPCSAVFNCSAVWFKDQVLLLLRVEDLRRENSFHVATSRDGLRFDVCPDPIDLPKREYEKRYDATRFDMRITPLDGTYYVCYASWAAGSSIAMARTDDFKRFEPVGGLSVPSNRNGALFPRKIGG
ncbi:MAG TPA: hypothetical protein PKB10_13410, partial [Tepidisphaeraceae bacterium]|nr:hypothetical protein [Tepidisphaeraceae bacterium]